jgi:hypothetical protein
VIESDLKDAPDRLQWAMNRCLAQSGIDHPGDVSQQTLFIDA